MSQITVKSVGAVRGSDLTTLRRLNGRAVLTALWDAADPRTVTQLATTTALSRPTVEAALADLQETGLVHAEAARTNGSGRPARAYRLAADAGVVIGVDAGPHGIGAVLGDLRGDELASHHLPSADLTDGATALRAILHAIDHLLAGTTHARDHVRALAIATPGIVGPDGDLVLSTVVPDWISHGLLAHLRAAYPHTHVVLDNDAKLAALAEIEIGAIAQDETAIVLQAGHRISAATVVDGRVARGAHGAAGEIGALESLGWQSAYARFERHADDLESTVALFSAASDGDALALEAVAQLADGIADGLSALALAIDPHRIVVGGGVSAVGEPFADALRERITARTLFAPELTLSALGGLAPRRGALALAARHVREAALSD